MSFSGTTTSAFGSVNAGMESADNSIFSIGRADNTSAYRNHLLFYRGNKTGAGIGFGTLGGGSNDATTIVWQNTSTGEQGYLNGNGIGLGSGNNPSSGIGVRFPATQSASSNANTLDDYEEGDWTPNTPAVGYTFGSASGRYVKIGKMVWVSCSISFSAVPANNSSCTFDGLPFAANGNAVAGVYRDNTTTGALYCFRIAGSDQTLAEINSMDGVGTGQQRTIRTSENYVGFAVYVVS
jgi:hypothetical protein